MDDPREDDLMKDLRALPPPAMAPLAAERIRRRARALFAGRAAHPGLRWLRHLERWYGRAEPALAIGVGVVYLSWALQVASALQR
jgi:hypothetical protein